MQSDKSKGMKFKSGDIVKIMDRGIEWSGEITIVKENGMCKFLSDNGDGPNYDYYPDSILTKITSEERDDLLDRLK